MEFEKAHEAFIEAHLNRRTGERRGRLERGHREAEKLFCKNVWWRLRGNFEGLHPEYEVMDWRGISYFCDFVWIFLSVKFVIEIKGFGPHVRDMDRQKYCNELNRETFLGAMGYQVVSFSYDDVVSRPDLCVTLFRMFIGRYQAEAAPIGLNGLVERETIRLACGLSRPIRPIDVADHLKVNHRVAVRTLRSLSEKGLFTPLSGSQGKHIVRYEMNPAALRLL